jgi:hypothetical protein
LTEEGTACQDVVIACLSIPNLVELDEACQITRIYHAGTSNTWITGGYFVFSKRIFDFMESGEGPGGRAFQRLIAACELITVPHHGFWPSTDTFKERQQLGISGRKALRHGGSGPRTGTGTSALNSQPGKRNSAR